MLLIISRINKLNNITKHLILKSETVVIFKDIILIYKYHQALLKISAYLDLLKNINNFRFNKKYYKNNWISFLDEILYGLDSKWMHSLISSATDEFNINLSLKSKSK